MEVSKEPFFKRVWYGAGKALESQSPKAWEKRILNVIDEKIIPKLGPADQAWLSEIRPKVEHFAKVAGVVTTASEITAVVAGAVGIGRGIGKLIEKRGIERILKGPKEIPSMPWKWAKTEASMLPKSLEQVLQLNFGDPNPQFTQWLGAMGDTYREKYGTNGAQLFTETIGIMTEKAAHAGSFLTQSDLVELARQYKDPKRVQEAVDLFHAGAKHNVWQDILDRALGEKRPEALTMLKDQFVSAYQKAAENHGSMGRVPTMMASQAFDRWQDLQLPGLETLLDQGQFVDRVGFANVSDAAKFLQRNAEDFEPLAPLTFSEILAHVREHPLSPMMEEEIAGSIFDAMQYQQSALDFLKDTSAHKEPSSFADVVRVDTPTIAKKPEQSGFMPRLKKIVHDRIINVGKGVGRVRESPRQAARRLNKAEARLKVHERVQEWVANAPERRRHEAAKALMEATREEQNAKAIADRAAQRLASRAAMGTEGTPRVRETSRQAAGRLEKADVRLKLQERVKGWRAGEKVKEAAAAKAKQQADWDREGMIIRARQEMEADLDQRARLQAAKQQAFKEQDRFARMERVIARGSTIDAALAKQNPELVAALAGKVATLKTNETSNAKELATLLIRVTEGKNKNAYEGLLEQLQKARSEQNSTETLSVAARLLEKAYNGQKGVKKIEGPYGMIDTKFTTLAAFWVQRLGLVGLGNLLSRS